MKKQFARQRTTAVSQDFILQARRLLEISKTLNALDCAIQSDQIARNGSDACRLKTCDTAGLESCATPSG